MLATIWMPRQPNNNENNHHIHCGQGGQGCVCSGIARCLRCAQLPSCHHHHSMPHCSDWHAHTSPSNVHFPVLCFWVGFPIHFALYLQSKNPRKVLSPYFRANSFAEKFLSQTFPHRTVSQLLTERPYTEGDFSAPSPSWGG